MGGLGWILAQDGRAAAVEQAAEQVAGVVAVVSTAEVVPLTGSSGAVAETGDVGICEGSSVWLCAEERVC